MAKARINGIVGPRHRPPLAVTDKLMRELASAVAHAYNHGADTYTLRFARSGDAVVVQGRASRDNGAADVIKP